MMHFPDIGPIRAGLVRALLLLALTASILVTSVPLSTSSVEAQQTQKLQVWSDNGGVVPNPQTWKYATSSSEANDLGTASVAALGYDDSTWQDQTLPWIDLAAGDFVAHHFRKDFTLAQIGVQFAQIESIAVELEYDDGAIMYLNGVEVYRSIRGNIDPTYVYGPTVPNPVAGLPPVPQNLPYDLDFNYGGWELDEDRPVYIPDPDGLNICQFPNDACTLSPYGSAQPPAIDPNLLDPTGVNTWSVTVWNRPSGNGSGDAGLEHRFALVVTDPPPVSVLINEVVASNDLSWPVDTDGDGTLESPDWFELINVGPDSVDLAGWTIADGSETWVFPSITMASGDYLVVAANDENDATSDPLQTNFKLSSLGDSLKLTDPNGFVRDEYAAMPQQFADNSYGRANDAGPPASAVYLATTTPGGPNSAAGDSYPPVLRLFANRLYNQGETVTDQVNAFDPDGDVLTYSLSSPPPGLTIDQATGEITGTLDTVGTFVSRITVEDTDNDDAFLDVTWVVLPPPAVSPPLLLNEYNAVKDTSELVGGSPVGNGGDWFEFVVVEDAVDLRGYTIELYDNKGDDDQLRQASTLTFIDDATFAQVPAGAIITISEEQPDDLSFDGITDWHVNLQITNRAEGASFEAQGSTERFNSTRDTQMVLIRDAAGEIVVPLAGETEAWDAANGGVNGGEVMKLCVIPTAGMTLDPLTSYVDVGTSSSFGQPNTCPIPDPADPDATIIFDQDLTALRATASLGVSSGDANCDGTANFIDALLIAQFTVGLRGSNTLPCAFGTGLIDDEIFGVTVDVSGDGSISSIDALIIAQCSVGLPNVWCP